MGIEDFDVMWELLEAAQEHSTTVGKVWITVLFVFRIVVLGTATKEVWDDEQTNFLCDTNQPGCQLVCYDSTFPVSHVRFWVMQIIFVSTPTLAYLGFVLHQIHIDKKRRKKSTTEDEKLKLLKKNSDNKVEVPLEGPVLKTYILNIVFKILFEVAFLIAQYCLYGFGLEPMYTCDRWPCLTKVFCYVSRPTEKTIFIIFMLIVALVSLLLNVVEMFYLCSKKKKADVSEPNPKQRNTDDKQVSVSSSKSYLQV